MPIKLHAPKAGRSPYWRMRGTYMGIRIDKSTGTTDRRVASKILAATRDQIERGAISNRAGPNFASALVSYLDAGGSQRFMTPLLEYWQETPLAEITQPALDACAVTLYPKATAATRNRQVYTPMSAVLRHAGVKEAFRRPKGWRGEARTDWLRPEDARRLLEAATARNKRFGALLTYLLFTGCRLGEALSLTWEDVRLSEATALVRKTKTGKPRAVHLPPILVSCMGELEHREGRVFRYHKSGRLYELLADAEKTSGVAIPPGVAFHIFRHTYGTLMRQLGADLQKIGAWASSEWRKYDHTSVTEAARIADQIPVRAKG